MSKILIISSDPRLVLSIQANLVKNFNHEVILKTDANDAISFLEIIGKVELIVVFEILTKEKFLFKISDYLVKNIDLYGKDIKLLSVGAEVCPYENTKYLPIKLAIDKINQTCVFLLGDGPEPSLEKSIPNLINPLIEKADNTNNNSSLVAPAEATTVFQLPKDFKNSPPPVENTISYSKINLKYLSFNKDYQINFDLYARIKKGNDYEYQIKFKKDSTLTKIEIDRLLTRGGGFLYLLEAEFKDASTFLVNQFLSSFLYEMSSIDRILLNITGYEILSEVFKKGEIDGFTIDLIKHCLKSFEIVTISAHNFEEFSDYLVSKGLTNYSYLHAHLTSMILIRLIDEFEWSKDYTKNKLIYFSYFHDLSIGSDKLHKAHHHYLIEKDKMNSDENNLLMNHANIAAKFLEKIIKLPKELVALIREHHGVLNGIGFSESPNVRILPLSKLIIVTECFVTKYFDEIANIEKGESYKITDIQFKKIIDELKIVFDKPGYIESIDAIVKKLVNCF